MLEATLRSVCRQTDDHYAVIVVHNERPPVGFESSKVRWVEVDLPAPSSKRGPEIPYDARMADKGAKYSVGIAEAQKLGASHVMLFDADDLIHRDLARLCASERDCPGWFSPQGYLHTEGTRSVHVMSDGFHGRCGSSSVVRADLIRRVPAAELGIHRRWPERLEEMGEAMRPLPFPAAVWVIGTGENTSGTMLSGRASIPISPEVTEMFGLLPPTPAVRAVRRIGVQARRLRRRIRSLS